ncbi:hypothetical protein SLUN_01435 [Streptomyces lunaelactis]|uniref:Uncharacterized protein n=2 Tax=Streptomyces lunaelactis TaxID=1535768 RepID=A0A2R4SW76_9ACTN|nr:hypothetical protein SLUN_01435 [Streptomyces lunaelactis]
MAVMAPVVAFGVGLWLAGSVFSGWLPRAEAERWAVAAAFATVAAGAVGAPLGWWAGRETRGGGRVVVQRATATEASRTTQIGGSRGGTASAPSGDVEQQAESSGTARITQIGGDQQTGGR